MKYQRFTGRLLVEYTQWTHCLKMHSRNKGPGHRINVLQTSSLALVSNSTVGSNPHLEIHGHSQ